MKSYLEVKTTFDSRDTAEKVAEKLVRERLCACAQVFGPITSIYWWKGKIEKSNEWVCIIKTTAKKYIQLEKAIKENHPYEVPEILGFKVTEGFRNYLHWLKEELEE